MKAQNKILIDGVPAESISALDRGFQYGDGVFETIAVYRGKPLLWERHLARLARGLERLAIPSLSNQLLQSEARQLCEGVTRGVLKIVVTRGVGGRGYASHGIAAPTRVQYLFPWPDYPPQAAREGVAVQLCQISLANSRRLAGIKHLNRLEQVLARAEWDAPYAEGLMRDESGNVIEGTMSNVFIVTDGKLMTPDLASAGVEGVMRGEVMEAAVRLGVSCEVVPLSLVDVRSAQEIFLTNSLIGVWPVRQLQDKHYVIGSVTRAVQEAVGETHCFDRV